MKFLKLFLSLLLFGSIPQLLNADVFIADIFSDHMVLQRNMELKIWGKADPGEAITLNFNGQKLKAKADNQGKWMVILKPMKFGGPYEMTIQGNNKLILDDILIGDVWLCSGQSNMAWVVKNSKDAKNEIKNAHHPNIRLLTVPNNISTTPVVQIPNSKWEICSPETITNFSAVGYFFGREILQELDIPIGLINSSYGGTCVESWTSKESIAQLPNYKGFDKRIEAFSIEDEKEKKREKLRNKIGELPKNETGITNKWMLPETDREDWMNMQLPSEWERNGYEDLDGIVWFSRDIKLNIADSSDNIELHLGIIDDSDIVWVNGTKVGETNWGFNEERVYSIPNEVIKPGNNNITVRIQDRRNKGGFISKPNEFFVKVGAEKIFLGGKWDFKVDQVYDNFEISPNEMPSLLYNAMINPLIQFGIKGVIWYQGEANARRAMEYRITFPNMINNWRAKWNQGDFPFLFVQLANFGQSNAEPRNSNWAELRESQTKTLSLKNTGMALAIDIGESNNIHPKNKQDVAKRLALNALKVAYNKNIVYSGPKYKSLKIEGNKAIISFEHIGSGLEVKDTNKEIKEFEVAGANQKFYKASAKIEGNQVIVWSENISNPMAVRFAWSNNPAEFNLYNKEGLPAIPFRTDDWKGITDGKSFDDL